MTCLRRGMLVAGIGLIVASGAIPAASEDSKEAIIKARQDFMDAQGDDVKAIDQFVKGEADQAKAMAAANDLVARGQKISALFVPGTSAADFPNVSFAKPELWVDDMARAKDAWSALRAEELKLVDVVKSVDKQAVGAELGAMGKAGCGSCHGAFRIKRS